MNPRRRRWLLIYAACAGAALAAIGWSYSYLNDARSSAAAEMDELAYCRQIAARLQSQHAEKPVSSRQIIPPIDLTRRITQVAMTVGLPADSVEGIRPDAARHSNNGAYIEKPTRLVLHHVTLKQLAAFLQAIDQRRDGLCIERLHLSCDNDPAQSPAWNLEAVLLYTAADEAKPNSPSSD